MKAKTINAIICKKFDDYLSSITDDNVKQLVNKNTIITGGCIASMLLKEKVNDFDLYFKNKETTLAIAKYYVSIFNKKDGHDAWVADGENASDVGRNAIEGGGSGVGLHPGRVKIIIKSAGVAGQAPTTEDEQEQNLMSAQEDLVTNISALDDIGDDVIDSNVQKYSPVFLSCNAITLSNKIQIIIRFYGEPKEIHDSYDFVHCTNFWTSWDRKLTLNERALESLLSRELIYIGSKYPLCSVIRTRKFLKRGFTVNAGQYLKMLFQASLLDLTDINVLEDQLIGVDVAYFGQLIDGLRSKSKNDKDFKLEYGYLATIIDRLF